MPTDFLEETLTGCRGGSLRGLGSRADVLPLADDATPASAAKQEECFSRNPESSDFSKRFLTSGCSATSCRRRWDLEETL